MRSYLNGDYDREEDHLIPGPGGGPLRQVSFAHRFFHRDGTPDRSSQANFLTGAASCTINENGRPSVHTADFRFGADTYAGAPVVIPLRDALLTQTARVIEFHYFTCVPGPRLVSVRATAGYRRVMAFRFGAGSEGRFAARLRLDQCDHRTVPAIGRGMV